MLSPDLLRDPYSHLDSKDALEQPTSSLLGVSEGAVHALAVVRVRSILDLAVSQLFANALDICLLAKSGTGRFRVARRVPADVLREGVVTPLADLPHAPVDVLNGFGDLPQMHALAVALDVATVGDLASWPPYWAACTIFENVYGSPTGEEAGDIPGTPQDLLPSSGEFPTERVQYEALLFDGFLDGAPADGHPIDAPVDIASLISEEGYRRPAIGGVLTFTQSWFTKALTLGNLIHSVTLAPGESTKIAMIDWSRRTHTGVTENLTEGDEIISDTVRARAISEVTRAVARETQRGRSGASSQSFAEERGESGGSAHLRDVDMTDLGTTTHPGVETAGTSVGTAAGRTTATGWSTTSGERDISASLAQDVVDRTHQASHAVRSRRASIVREAYQAEREQISTRSLTNYNHMHALTMEYYEVVQLYLMSVEVTRADRCAFIPLKLLDFQDQRVVDRYRAVLAASALTPAVAQILHYPPGTAQIRAVSVDRGGLAPQPAAGSDVPGPKDQWWWGTIAGFRRQTGFEARVTSDGRLVLPADAVVDNFTLNVNTGTGQLVAMTVTKTDGTTVPLDGWGNAPESIKLSQLASVAITADGVAAQDSLALFMSGRYRGSYLLYPLVPMLALKSAENTVVMTCATTSPDALANLVDNQLYYSQAVWNSLDPATIGMMLSQLTWPNGGQQRPLVELVDPTPVAVAANYLVMRLTGDSAADREEWLTQKKITLGQRHEELVPIPSGGVFGEAVLGRSNSAERLEITRFWNWQDSPIPVTAPEISPIQAGSRGEPDPTTPSTLGPSILNLVNPPALPDPQGMGAVLAAVQNGNMFRDMSGLAATIGLSQAGLAGVQQAATSAAAQAGHNAEVAAQLGAKVAELVADVAKAYLGGGGGGAGTSGIAGLTGGLTGQGAKIAQGQDMDRRGVTGTLPTVNTGGSSRSGHTARNSGFPHASRTRGSNETAAFRTALGGSNNEPSQSQFEQAVARAIGGTLEGGQGSQSGEWVYWSSLINHSAPPTLVEDLRQPGAVNSSSRRRLGGRKPRLLPGPHLEAPYHRWAPPLPHGAPATCPDQSQRFRRHRQLVIPASRPWHRRSHMGI